MPYDMTLCYGYDCPIKQDCDRFTRKAYGRQNYFGSIPYNVDSQSCEDFRHRPKPTDRDVRVHAYYLWQRSGCPEGQDTEIWLQARLELEEYFGG